MKFYSKRVDSIDSISDIVWSKSYIGSNKIKYEVTMDTLFEHMTRLPNFEHNMNFP